LSRICLVSVVILLFAALLHADDYSNTEKSLLEKGLVDVMTIDSTLRVDLKYSTKDNFMQADAYGDLEKCFLQKEAAQKLSQAQKILKKMHPNCSLLLYDCVRPRSVQKRMWGIVKGTKMQKYVADPQKGSIHNYGAAVDLTIMDEKDGKIDMGTPFDFFGDLAQPRYEKRFLKEGKLTAKQIFNRNILRRVMTEAGFYGIEIEWWHFNAFPKEVVRERYKIVE